MRTLITGTASPPSLFPCGGSGLPPVAGPAAPGAPCR